MKPIVSIALPVYNGASTLDTAIRSILKQSFQDWELIILDDASTDDSVDVMRTFDDPRIRLVEGEENIGLSARLNMAIDMANSNLFARMDQDDISHPDRIEKQVEFLQKHPDIDLLATSIIVVLEEGKIIGRLPVSSEHKQICAHLWNGFYMPHPTWMGRTSWFLQYKYNSSANGAEDQHLLLRTYRTSQFACLTEPLLAYREGLRPLKKMLRYRRIFMRAYLREFASHKRYGMMIGVTVVSSIKMVADVLNLVFGIACMRNRLLPLNEEEQSKWNLVWDELKSN